jgi:hypothetical protein
MSESDISDGTPDGTAFTAARSTAERLAEHPLLVAIGDCATSQVLLALLNAHPYPLTPAQIAEAAGISRSTWYEINDELLAGGMVVERGQQGNAPLYGLPDDERVEALEILRSRTGECLFGDRELRLDE